MKEFSLLEILSLISGYLLIKKFDRLHELIEWIAGSPIFTHQISSVADILKKKAVEQFPQFNLQENISLNNDIEVLVKTLKRKDNETVLIEEMKLKYGETFLVKQGERIVKN